MRRIQRALLALILLLLSPAAHPAPAPPRPAKTVAYWLKQLRTGDVLQRQDAIEALGRMGPRAAKAIPALAAVLDDPRLCRPAAFALGKIGPKAIPALVKAFGEKQEEAAATALARIGRAAVPALVEALKTSSLQDQRTIVRALNTMGPQAEEAVPALVKLLRCWPLRFQLSWKEWNPGVAGMESVSLPVYQQEDECNLAVLRAQADVALALRSIGPAAVPAITQALDRPDRIDPGTFLLLYPSVLREALSSGCEEMPKNANLLITVALLLQRVPGALEAAWRDRECMVREWMVSILESSGPADRRVVPVLIRALGDSEEKVRLRAVKALSRMGPAARSAEPILLRRLRNERGDEILAELADTLRAIGPPAQEVLEREVIPILIAKMKQLQKAGKSLHVAKSLAQLAPHAALPVLRKLLLQDLNYDRARQVFDALACAGKEAVPVLVQTLAHHDDVDIREEAACTLKRLRPRPLAALPALRAALTDSDDVVRLEALQALIHLEPDRARLVAVLIDSLGNSSAVVRTAAARQLLRLGRHARPAVAALQKALDDRDDEVVCVAAQALLKLRASPCKPLACLSRLVAKRHASVDKVLRDLGGRARAVSPALEKLLKDENPQVCLEAACTLYSVNPGVRPAVRVFRQFLRTEPTRSHLVDALCQLPCLPRELILDLRDLLPEPGAFRPITSDFEWRSPSGVWVDERFQREDRAFLLLGRLGADAAVAVPVLVEHLKSKRTAFAAAYALGCVGSGSSAAIPDLLPLLKDVDPDVRGEVAFALGQLGPAARAVVPRLRPLLDDDDWRVRVRAAAALFQLTGDTKHALPCLVRELTGDAKRVLPRYIRELHYRANLPFCRTEFPCLKPSTRRAVVRTLARDLQAPDARVRLAAVKALESLGVHARSVAPRLVSCLRQLLDSSDEDIAQSANEALEAIETNSER